MTRRDKNHLEIAAGLVAHGCTVVDTSAVGGGFPDLVVGARGVTHLLEVKNPDRRTKGDNAAKTLAKQEKFLSWWRGAPVSTVRTLVEAARAVGVAAILALALVAPARATVLDILETDVAKYNALQDSITAMCGTDGAGGTRPGGLIRLHGNFTKSPTFKCYITGNAGALVIPCYGITIEGDGGGTVVRAAFDVRTGGFILRNLSIKAAGSPWAIKVDWANGQDASGVGVGGHVSRNQFQSINIDSGTTAIKQDGGILCSFRNVWQAYADTGLVIQRSNATYPNTTTSFYDCVFTTDNAFNVYATSISGLQFYNCDFEQGCVTSGNAGVYITSMQNLIVQGCNFENDQGAGTISSMLNCTNNTTGALVVGNNFRGGVNTGGGAVSRAILMQRCRGFTVANNRIEKVRLNTLSAIVADFECVNYSVTDNFYVDVGGFYARLDAQQEVGQRSVQDIPVASYAALNNLFGGGSVVLSPGDVVHLPKGRYVFTDTVEVTIPLTIEGDGDSTVIQTGSATMCAFAIDPTLADIGGRIVFKNLRFEASANGTSAVKTLTVAGRTINSIIFDRCTAVGFTNAFDVGGAGMTTNGVVFRDCIATGNRGNGFALTNCSSPLLENCVATGNNTAGSASMAAGAQVILTTCPNFSVRGLTVGTFTTSPGASRVGLALSGCVGGTVDAYTATDAALQADSYAMRCVSGTKGVNVGSLSYSKVQFPVTIDGTSKFPLTSSVTLTKF